METGSTPCLSEPDSDGGSLATALKEFIDVLTDREWHEIYEIHEKYRLAPILIFRAMHELLRLEIIIKKDRQVRLKENLPNEKISLINKLQKTKKPQALQEFTLNRLTYNRFSG